MTESKPYNGLLGLDRLPKEVKIVIWIAVSLWAIDRGLTAANQVPPIFGRALPSVPYELYAIYIITPVAKTLPLMGAGLRLAGIRWVYVLAFLVITSLLIAFFSVLIVFGAIMQLGIT